MGEYSQEPWQPGPAVHGAGADLLLCSPCLLSTWTEPMSVCPAHPACSPLGQSLCPCPCVLVNLPTDHWLWGILGTESL